MAKMTLDELVTQLRAAYRERLASVVLYGSAAGGDHIPNRSDYNVLVLLDGRVSTRRRRPRCRPWRVRGARRAIRRR